MAENKQPTPRTNRQDVLMTFQRYMGRPAVAGDMTEIDNYTRMDPQAVEKALADKSPITNGKLWSEYQQNPTGADNLPNDLHSFVDSTDHTPEEKALLKFLSDNETFVSENPQLTEEELRQKFTNATTQAEMDISPYFDKIKSQDLETLKTKMGDIRRQVGQYAQSEALNYKQKLRQTKESLASRGMTFSGSARQQLGKEGALDDKGVEGEVPQERRYNFEVQSDKAQQAMRDMGREAEQRYGSGEIGKVQGEFGEFNNPFKGGKDYVEGQKSAMYNVSKEAAAPAASDSRYWGVNPNRATPAPDKGYVRGGAQTQYATGANKRYASTYDLQRQAAIEQARNKKLGTTTY